MSPGASAGLALQDMALFVEVAHALSFTRASAASGVPIATLSRRIAALEKRAGVRLFERGVRRLTLTDPGRRYLESCERVVQEAAIAHDRLREAAERPAGHLRISTPVEFGLSHIAPIIDEFARNYPDITMDLDLSPRPALLADEKVDVSIRLGDVRDPALVVRRLGSAARLLYAAPAYLAKRGAPSRPEDLGGHDCILQSYMAEPDSWRLVSEEDAVDIAVKGRFATNNVSMTLRLAELGYGIAALSPAVARPALDPDSVRRVLEGWRFPPMPVHAVMTSRLIPARARVFIDFLAARLAV